MENVVNLNDYQEEVMEGEELEMQETTEVVEEAKGNDLVKGLLIGLGFGLATAGTAWYLERRKRMTVLAKLEDTNKIADAVFRGKDSIVINKKEINLAEKRIKNGQQLVEYIKEEVLTVVKNKKEKERWENVIDGILDNMLNQTERDAQKKLDDMIIDANESEEQENQQ